MSLGYNLRKYRGYKCIIFDREFSFLQRQRKAKRFKIRLTNSDRVGKGAVDLKNGIIYIKQDFYNENYNSIFLLFVIFHEIGHFFYKTELKCDFYSINQLIRLGFKPLRIKKNIFIRNKKRLQVVTNYLLFLYNQKKEL